MAGDAAQGEVQYVGFWKRFIAFLIDSALLLVLIVPLLIFIYGSSYFSLERLLDPNRAQFAGLWDFLLQVVLPTVALVVFWRYKGATPGKMAISAKVVDAQTGKPASTARLVVRCIAYIASMIPAMLGFAWIGIDRRKQGFHDKIAGTLVVYDKDAK